MRQAEAEVCAWPSEVGCIHCLCERVDLRFLRLVIVGIRGCPLLSLWTWLSSVVDSVSGK